MDKSPLREKILASIINKSTLKQHIFDNAFTTFNELKDVLFEIASELDDDLDGKLDKRVRIEYRDRGKFEAQLQIASDLLWQNDYVKEERDNSYCGVIDIYNFLSDSFKFNRSADEGYLIGRIFINREKCYFVEGKRQSILRPAEFGNQKITREALIEIMETAINYAINFDPLMPPYELNKRVTVDQFNTKMDNSKFTTGKRLGYEYNIDDI